MTNTSYQLLADTRFNWKGFGNGFGDWDSYCYLKFIKYESRTVMILSDSHTGTSISNCAEYIQNLIVEQYDLAIENLDTIHHYPHTPGLRDLPHSFDIVTFDNKYNTFTNPKWIPLIFSNHKENRKSVYEVSSSLPEYKRYLVNIVSDLYSIKL